MNDTRRIGVIIFIFGCGFAAIEVPILSAVFISAGTVFLIRGLV